MKLTVNYDSSVQKYAFSGLEGLSKGYSTAVRQAAAKSLITFGSRINRVYTDGVEDFYGSDTKLSGVARAYVSVDGKALGSTERKASHKFIEDSTGIEWLIERGIKDKSIRGGRRNLELFIGFSSRNGLSNEVAHQREFGRTRGGKGFIHSGKGMIIPLYGRGAQMASGQRSQGSNAEMAAQMAQLPRRFQYNQLAVNILKAGRGGGGSDRTGAKWSSDEFWTETYGRQDVTTTFFDEEKGVSYTAPKHSDKGVTGIPGERGTTKPQGKWISMAHGRSSGSGNVMAIFVFDPFAAQKANANYGHSVHASSAFARDLPYPDKTPEGLWSNQNESEQEAKNATVAARSGSHEHSAKSEGYASDGIPTSDLWNQINHESDEAAKWLSQQSGYATNRRTLQNMRDLAVSEYVGSAYAMLTSQHSTTQPLIGFTAYTPRDMPAVQRPKGQQGYYDVAPRQYSLNKGELKMVEGVTEEAGGTAYFRKTARPHAYAVSKSGESIESMTSGLSVSDNTDTSFDFYVKTGGGSSAKRQYNKLKSGKWSQEDLARANKGKYTPPRYETIVKDSVGKGYWGAPRGTAKFIWTSTGISMNRAGAGVGKATGLTNVIGSTAVTDADSRANKGQSPLIANYLRHNSEAKAFRLTPRTKTDVLGGRDAVAGAYKHHRAKSREAFTQMSKSFAQLDLAGPVMTESDSRSASHRSSLGQFTKKQGLGHTQPLFAKVRMVRIGEPTGIMKKSISDVSKRFNPMQDLHQNLKEVGLLDNELARLKGTTKLVRSIGNEASVRWERATRK